MDLYLLLPVGTDGGRVTVIRVEVWDVWVVWDFLEAGDDFASSCSSAGHAHVRIECNFS